MRRSFAIAGLNFTQLFRDRSELASVILLPLLLTWVFGSAFGSSAAAGNMVVPVSSLDTSVYADAIIAAIDAPEAISVKRVTPVEAHRRVRDGDAGVVVLIPRGFGEDVEHDRAVKVKTVRDPGSTQAQAVVEVVNGAVGRIAANAEAARISVDVITVASGGTYPAGAPDFRELYAEADRFWSPDPPVGVTLSAVAASSARASEMKAPSNTQYSLGFTVFFVLMVALGSASGIMEERELGTLRRLLAAPITRAQIVFGKVLGVAFVASFEAAILVGFGALVFGVPWGNAPLAVAMLLGALVIAATGLGIMLSALLNTRSQLSALTPVVSTALAMLGGCYWPIDVTPPVMQKIALFTPTGWAMIGLKDAVARGLGVEAVLVPTAVMLGMGALFFAIGLSRLRLE